MNTDNITINRTEALRYMGHFGEPDERLNRVMDECEIQLKKAARPRFVWRLFDVCRSGELSLNGCGFSLVGEDISQHLSGCDKAAVIAVTLSADVDRYLKQQTLSDGLCGLVADAMANVMVELVAEQARVNVLRNMEEYNATWCYAAGYGDFPLEMLPKLLGCVDAPRKIGLSCTATNMLTPQKSIVGIIGLSKDKVTGKIRGCGGCNMRENCAYRKSGAGTCVNGNGGVK